MRLIKIQLKHSVPFWSLSGLTLTSLNPTSESIDIDALTENQFDVIEKAIRQREINVLTMDGQSIRSINEVKLLNDYSVSVDDLEDEPILPEVNSVTVSLDDNEPLSPLVSTRNLMEEALIIINNNGNTVKKMLSSIDVNDTLSKDLLMTCLSTEIGAKNRVGVIDAINERLGECS